MSRHVDPSTEASTQPTPQQRELEAANSPKTSWVCPGCSMTAPAAAIACPICTYCRPSDPTGIPQIFAGLVFHFNGVIPRNMPHPSFSPEWRMAARHGARVLDQYFADLVTHLIFRPGYERSDKVRFALQKNKACVPIEWMMDSMHEGRQVQEWHYRLHKMPDKAMPTVNSTVLPHHSHPYFQCNKAQYPIPKDLSAPLRQAAAAVASPTPVRVMGAKKVELVATPKLSSMTAPPQWPINKKAQQVFTGFVMALSPSCGEDAAEACAARGALIRESMAASDVTHIIVAHEDRKKGIVIDAIGSASPDTVVCTTRWPQDCLLLNEKLPVLGPYKPPPKWMEYWQSKAGTATADDRASNATPPADFSALSGRESKRSETKRSAGGGSGGGGGEVNSRTQTPQQEDAKEVPERIGRDSKVPSFMAHTSSSSASRTPPPQGMRADAEPAPAAAGPPRTGSTVKAGAAEPSVQRSRSGTLRPINATGAAPATSTSRAKAPGTAATGSEPAPGAARVPSGLRPLNAAGPERPRSQTMAQQPRSTRTTFK